MNRVLRFNEVQFINLSFIVNVLCKKYLPAQCI